MSAHDGLNWRRSRLQCYFTTIRSLFTDFYIPFGRRSLLLKFRPSPTILRITNIICSWGGSKDTPLRSNHPLLHHLKIQTNETSLHVRIHRLYFSAYIFLHLTVVAIASRLTTGTNAINSTEDLLSRQVSAQLHHSYCDAERIAVNRPWVDGGLGLRLRSGSTY